MSDPYREGAPIPSRRRVDADVTISAVDPNVDALLLLLVPSELRERIERLRKAGEEASDDDRVELAEALQEALAIGGERQRDLRHLPTDHPDPPSLEDLWGQIGTETAAAPIVEKVAGIVREIDGSAEVTRTGPRITARLETKGAPIVWSIHLGAPLVVGGEVRSFAASSHWMATRAAKDLPRVFLRAEGAADTVLKALRLRTEVEIGDEKLDDAFFVEGDGPFVRPLFTRELREAFVQRGDAGQFTFLLHDATASLAWKEGLTFGHVHAASFLASAEVLVAVRAALGCLPLVRAE